MDPNDKQMLGVLIGTAKEQQAVLGELLKALAVEIKQLHAASTHTSQAVISAQQAAATTAQVAKEAAQHVAKAARDGASGAVGPAVTLAMEDVQVAAREAMTTAATPALAQLAGHAQAVQSAYDTGTTRLNAAARWVGWKLFAVLAGGLLAVWGFAWYGLWIAREDTRQLVEQRQALAAEIEGMKQTVAELDRRGGKLVFSECAGRRCIQASPNQGTPPVKWEPPFKDTNGVGWVIPKGY